VVCPPWLSLGLLASPPAVDGEADAAEGQQNEAGWFRGFGDERRRNRHQAVTAMVRCHSEAGERGIEEGAAATGAAVDGGVTSKPPPPE